MTQPRTDPPDDDVEIEFVDGPCQPKIISTRQFEFEQSNEQTLRILISLNKGHLINLAEGRQFAVRTQDKRQNLILYELFKLKYFTIEIEFEYLKATNELLVSITILHKQTDKFLGHAKMVMHYHRSRWCTEMLEPYQMEAMTLPIKWTFRMQNIQIYLDKNLYLSVDLKFRSVLERCNSQKYAGLENQGNTCYMNSFLQTLFFIKPLRKIILEIDCKDNPFLIALQKTFSMMLDEGKTVSPLELIQSAPWSRDFLFHQQDIHEFKMQLFDQLQKVNKIQLQRLFAITSISKVRCPEVNYVNETVATGYEIQLHLIKKKGQNINNIVDALDFLCRQEQLETPIQTETFGRQLAIKTVKFRELPPFLFFNLKRYEFQGGQMNKLTSKFTFSNQLEMSRYTLSGEPAAYQLYGILVHKGKESIRGHYYSFINTSTEQNVQRWYRFDDCRVTEAEQTQAIRDNFGGIEKVYRFSNESESFVEESHPKQSTAYILVYIKYNEYNALQQTVCVRPPWLQIRHSQPTIIDSSTEQLPIVLIDSIFGKVDSIFDERVMEHAKRVRIKLNKSIGEQERQIVSIFDRNSQGTLWRVCPKQRSITNLLRRYSGNSAIARDMLHGHGPFVDKSPFFILFIPKIHFQGDSSQIRALQIGNNLALLFIQNAWDDNDEYRFHMDSVMVFDLRKKETLEKVMMSDYTQQILYRNGEVVEIDSLNFRRKLMYCELVRSFLRIEPSRHGITDKKA